MDEVAQIAQLLKQTLSSNDNAIRVATDSLDCLSVNPNFPFYLLSIATGSFFPFPSSELLLKEIQSSELWNS